jgi:hypothetical protein
LNINIPMTTKTIRRMSISASGYGRVLSDTPSKNALAAVAAGVRFNDRAIFAVPVF